MRENRAGRSAKSAPELSRQPPGLPAVDRWTAGDQSMGLGRAAIVLQRTAGSALSETLEHDIGRPGVKPVTPALPLVPNRVEVVRSDDVTRVFYFRREGRLVAGNQAIVEREYSDWYN